MEFFELAIGSIFINNIILAQFLGICPFIGTSKKMETAVGMSMAVVFVMVMAGMITWCVDTYLLKAYEIEFLRTVAFPMPKIGTIIRNSWKKRPAWPK